MGQAPLPEEALPLEEPEAALRELLRRARSARSWPWGLPMPQELPLQNHDAAYCRSFIRELLSRLHAENRPILLAIKIAELHSAATAARASGYLRDSLGLDGTRMLLYGVGPSSWGTSLPSPGNGHLRSSGCVSSRTFLGTLFTLRFSNTWTPSLPALAISRSPS